MQFFMKRLLTLIAIGLVALLAGCGGSGGDSSSAGPLADIGDSGGSGDGTGTSDPDTVVGSVSIVFGDGSTSATLIANGTDFRLVRVTVLDTNGDPVSGETVSFTTTAGQFQDGSTITNLATTNDSGLASLNLVAPEILGTATINANVSGITSGDISASFVPGPPADILVFAAPLELQPTGTATVDVRVTDENGFPVSGETVTFSFSTQESGLSQISPAFPVTDESGQVTVTYTAGAQGGTQAAPFTDTFVARTTNGTTSAPVSIQIATDAVVISDLSLTGVTSVVVGDSVGLTARVSAASGNPELIPVTFTISDTTLGDLNGATTAANPSVTDSTNINGDAFATFNAGTSVGTVTISATASGFTRTLVIDITSGPPASLSLVAAPNPVFVESPQNKNQADIVATVLDANGNPVPSETIDFNIFIADNETGGSVDPVSATTNLSGVARTVYSAGGTPGTDTITAEATSSPVSGTVSVTAQPDIGKVASLLIGTDKTVLPTGDTATLTVTALDSRGQPVPGVTPTAISSGSAVLTGDTTTDSFGELTLTLTDAIAEDVTVTISAGSLTTQQEIFFGPTLSFVPDAVSGIGEVELTVRLLNGSGVPIQGAPINFSIVSSTDEFIDQLDFETQANGTARLLVTDPDTGGTVVIGAQSSGVSSTTNATVTFQTEPGEFALTAVAENTVIQSGGNSDVTAIVVNTADGTPAGGINLTVDVTGSATATPVNGTTDSFGRFEFNVSDAVDEDVTVTVTDSSGVLTTEVPLFFGATVQLFPPTATGVADGSTATELQATVRSAAGSGISATPVDFSVTSGSAIISGSRIETDATGVARVGVTNSTIETATVQASAGTAPADSSDIEFTAGSPANITLVASATQLSLFGTSTLTATVTDVLGNPVPDNTAVNFTTTGGSVTSTVATSSGQAVATFDAGTVAGLYTVTATSGSVSDTVDIEVQSLDAGTIRVDSVDPEFIQVFGTTGEQTSTIRFLVRDAAGNPVDGEVVTIFLDPKQLGGGEVISSGGPFATSVTATTGSDGIAQVTVRSGTVSGTLDITAEVDPDDPDVSDGDEFGTVAQVTIVGGVADGSHFTLAASTLNLAGGLYIDLPSTISAIVADRFGNIVPDGSKVSFESECGRIGESAGFTSSTEQGVATAVFRTSNPMIPSDDLRGPSDLGRTGLCRILAYTTGDESFFDANGNGVFDAGTDTCTGDLSEPYIDANDNGVHDAGELFVDIDGLGSFDGPNGTCDSDTTIWTGMNLLMTRLADLELDTFPVSGGPLSVDLAIGESQTYAVTYGDEFDNAVVAGTNLTVERIQGSGGGLFGTTEIIQGDTTGTENTAFFTVASDLDPDADPETLEIKVTLTSSDAQLTDAVTGGTTGNNNGITVFQTFTVNINQPEETAPTVAWTVPADGATNVPGNSEMTIMFSEEMAFNSISNTTIQTSCGGTPYNFGSVTAFEAFDQWVFSHDSSSTFPAGTTCTVTVTTGVLDAGGTPLASEYVFSFDVQP